MKQLKITLITLLFCGVAATAQGTVEKSLFNAQTGAVGFWMSHEAKLGNKFALRSEAGLDLWYYDTYSDGDGTVLVPSISIEPRWYYNIAKRSEKSDPAGKYTRKNCANFVTIAIEYYPNSFIVGDIPDYIYVPDQLSIIPKWGIRRHIGQSNFNYEVGIGLGYFTYLNEDDKRLFRETSGVAADIHLRIGYTF